ncbi:MAG: hypothetical protein WBW84_15125 [Acidobacteriaceae bacterium]
MGWAINNNGVIAGWDSGGGVIITFSPGIGFGSYISLDADPSSSLYGINDDDETVGADSIGGIIVEVSH